MQEVNKKMKGQSIQRLKRQEAKTGALNTGTNVRTELNKRTGFIKS